MRPGNNSGTAAADPQGAYYSAEDFKRIRKADVHLHLNTTRFDLAEQAREDNFTIISINVDFPGYPPVSEQQELCLRQVSRFPGSVYYLTTFETAGINDKGWSDRQLEYLKDSFKKGAIGIKVWKNIGMTITDDNGRFIQIDDPLFDPIFDYLEQHGVSVTGHLGEPLNCWLPLEEMTTHNDRDYFSGHPQYHMYLHPEYPSYEELMRARDHLLEKHPRLKFIGAHLASFEWSVDELAKRLDAYPNMAVDLAERMSNLQHQSIRDREKVRDFFIRYQDRIMYGSDLVSDESDEPGEIRSRAHRLWTQDWTYFTGNGEMQSPLIDGTIMGLRLPSAVIDKIYYANALKWFGLS